MSYETTSRPEGYYDAACEMSLDEVLEALRASSYSAGDSTRSQVEREQAMKTTEAMERTARKLFEVAEGTNEGWLVWSVVDNPFARSLRPFLFVCELRSHT